MGELFDNLLGMLPAVLFFLFLMRRLFGRRGGARKTEGAEDAGGGEGITGAEAEGKGKDGAGAGAGTGPGAAFRGAAARIRKALGTAGTAPGVSAYSEGSAGNESRRRNQERKGPAPVPPAVRRVSVPELNRRVIDSNPKSQKAGSRKSSSLARIERLPPPARGVLWSVILGEPPGMKDL